MRVEEEQVLFDAVEPQKHLRIAIGDEAQNVAAGRMRTLDVCHDADGRGTVRAHAVDDDVREFGRQYVRLQQFRVSPVRPLLWAGPLLLH